MEEQDSTILESPGVIIQRSHNVLFRVGITVPDAEHVGILHSTLEQMLETHEKVGMLAWLPQGAAVPDGSGRSRAITMLRALGPRLGGVLVISAGTGFWASATRSVLTGLTLMARVALPVKVATDPVDGCTWLGRRLEPTMDGQTLLETSNALVARLDQGEGAASS